MSTGSGVERNDAERARVLIEALPYIKRFSQQTIIIKYGGSLLSEPEKLLGLAQDIALLKYVGIKPVIVHGGGLEIKRWLERFGKKQRVVEGQFFTDEESLEIIDMVLSGNISNAIVTSLNKNGVRAVGLSGRDADLFTTRRIKTAKNIDIGYVGEVESTNIALLRILSDQGYVPVISSVGVSREGTALNVDSDLVAVALASALRANKLIFASSSQGLSGKSKLIDMLDLSQAAELLRSSDLPHGVQLKLSAAISAIKGGVVDVHIVSGKAANSVLLEIFTDKGIGTMITNRKMHV